MQQGSGLPQSAWASILVDDFIQIAERCGDDVILFNHAGDVLIVQTVLLLSLGVDIIIHDFAERVFFMHGFGKIEIAAIMAESVVVGINVLPSPILRGQFAIAWIAVGDVLSFVIVERPGETIAAFVQANLHRLHDIALKSIHILMRGDEQANALVVVSFDLFGLLTLGY